jgi:hypothetical protein
MEDKYIVNVAPEFRTHELSLTPGGSVVEVYYRDRIKVYDNVKHPKPYIGKIISEAKEPIVEIRVNGIPTKFN